MALTLTGCLAARSGLYLSSPDSFRAMRSEPYPYPKASQSATR